MGAPGWMTALLLFWAVAATLGWAGTHSIMRSWRDEARSARKALSRARGRMVDVATALENRAADLRG
jgi:hypothetical protein